MAAEKWSSKHQTSIAKTADNLHVLMLPWSAFGHMIPFYQIPIAVVKQGFGLSYVLTPKNNERLPEIPPDLVALM